MNSGHESGSDMRIVPLFPLPNIVLFPRAVLPLHIFEERYTRMTVDVLAGARQIAMALLKPGWELNYYSRPAVEPVVCVGEILSYERLSGGEYNFLLQGRYRARIVREIAGGPYRRAELQPWAQSLASAEDLTEFRQRLLAVFSRGALGGSRIAASFRQLLSSPLPTEDVADVIAFSFLEEIALKQSLLAEEDVSRRVARLVEAMEAYRPPMQMSLPATPDARWN